MTDQELREKIRLARQQVLRSLGRLDEIEKELAKERASRTN